MNGIIYEIYCSNLSIKDTYIGYTTNFPSAKSTHKLNIYNGKSNKLYDFIRAHGGWDNFRFRYLQESKYTSKDELFKEYLKLRREFPTTLNDDFTIPNHLFCEHNKELYLCIDCGCCEHGILRLICDNCKNTCIHKKTIFRCGRCSWYSTCFHNKYIIDCKSCLIRKLKQSKPLDKTTIE